MNKKVIFCITIIICLYGLSLVYAQWTVPRQVIQEVYDFGGSYPDNRLYPEDGTISFRAYITSRPEYVLTEEHASSYATINYGVFVIIFNLGNFPTLTDAPKDWTVGERVSIEVLHKPTGRIGYSEFEIDEKSSGIIRRNEEAIILQDPPEEE